MGESIIAFLSLIFTLKMPTIDEPEEGPAPKALDDEDIHLLKTYGKGPYLMKIKSTLEDISKKEKHIKTICGIKDSDTGLAPPSLWDLPGDKEALQAEQPLQVARCTKIIQP